MCERPLISISRLAAYRRCPRLHRIRYVDLVRPVDEAETLRFGKLVHLGLEAWWRAMQHIAMRWRATHPDGPFPPEVPAGVVEFARGRSAPEPRLTIVSGVLVHMSGDPLESALAMLELDHIAGRSADDDYAPPNAAELTPALAELVRAEEMLRAYDRMWRTAQLEPLAVEAEFVAPMVNPATGARSQTFDLAGKIDAIARRWHEDGTSDVVLVEHKTSSEDVGPGSAYRRRLRMDGQVSAYHDGALALGHEVVGCVYDVLVKPRMRPLKATPMDARKYKQNGALYANQRASDETLAEYRTRVREAIAAEPEAYLVREEIVRLEAELQDASADVWDSARMIRESELAGRWPRNPAACQAYGRDCEYFEVCSGGARLDDPTRFRRADRAHEELTPATTPTEET